MSTPQATNTVYDKHQNSLRHDHENHQSCDTLSKIKRFGISLNNRYSAAAGVVFLLGIGYYFLSRHQNKIATLAKKLQGRDTSEAAAMMHIRCKDGEKSLVKDVVKKIAAADPGNPLNSKPLAAGLVSLGDKGVGLLCFALDSTLFLAIIDPHIGVTPPPGITQEEGKLNLLAGASEDTEVAFSVYSIPYTDSPTNRAHVVTIAVTFAVSALRQHTVDDATPLTAHQLLESHHFPRDHCIFMGGKQICIVASRDDFGYLTKTFVDYRGEGHSLSSAELLDFKFYDIWDERTDITMLIGGEPGSGKTWAMITNMFSRTDLTVYIRLLSSLTIDELNSLDDIKVRNGLFCGYAARAVKEAINSVCAALDRKLMEYDDPEPFYVRICFDEIGGSPALTRACCAPACAKNLHKALRWRPRVEARIFAAGTGIGTVNNPGGSENSCFNLIMLSASRGRDLYWMYRCTKLLRQVDTLLFSGAAGAVNVEFEKKKNEFRAKLADLTLSVTSWGY
ncbi:transmembrane protein, putative [Bodo saltans]|uniref:Transmembrane protein, putative n=1 Tax=Bodo saltans TaxID=75058 RepID=A0A0S4JA08_BODSA|nr:transmembrane protein, putative [Bodo saltans]|eukprot:CUG85924.1 transmembrane protein, putative [Bodo saltans]